MIDLDLELFKGDCVVCGGRKQLTALNGSHKYDFKFLEDCPLCNGGQLVKKGDNWVKPQEDNNASQEEIIFGKLPFDMVVPMYVIDIASIYNEKLVDAYLDDMNRCDIPCTIEEWMKKTRSF